MAANNTQNLPEGQNVGHGAGLTNNNKSHFPTEVYEEDGGMVSSNTNNTSNPTGTKKNTTPTVIKLLPENNLNTIVSNMVTTSAMKNISSKAK
jgi:hypothetical protein